VGRDPKEEGIRSIKSGIANDGIVTLFSHHQHRNPSASQPSQHSHSASFGFYRLNQPKMRPVAFLLPALAAASPVGPVVGNDGWADAPDPSDIQIVAATFSGNGCPQGTVSTNISPDKTVRPSLSWTARKIRRGQQVY
jgi:hypothetical protein